MADLLGVAHPSEERAARFPSCLEDSILRASATEPSVSELRTAASEQPTRLDSRDGQEAKDHVGRYRLTGFIAEPGSGWNPEPVAQSPHPFLAVQLQTDVAESPRQGQSQFGPTRPEIRIRHRVSPQYLARSEVAPLIHSRRPAGRVESGKS
jgi:hypothetical protein